MKLNITLMVCLNLLFALSGCAKYGQISNIKSGEQEIIFRDGLETTLSNKKHTVAIALGNNIVKNGERAEFQIFIKNCSDENFVFSTENIAASIEGCPECYVMKVLNYEELMAEEKKRQKMAALSAALQGMSESLNANNAGYSNTYGTYSGNTYSNYGASAYSSGSFSSTTYNYGAAQAARDAANARMEARLHNIAADGKSKLDCLSNSILKKQTVFPEEWHGGIVKIQMPPVSESPTEFIVDVNVDDEHHAFLFEQIKTESQN